MRKLIQFSQFLELQGDTNADYRFFMLVYDFAMGAWYFWRAVVSLHGATEGCDLWVFPLFDYWDFVLGAGCGRCLLEFLRSRVKYDQLLSCYVGKNEIVRLFAFALQKRGLF